jgi:hypothetical protein
VHPSDGKIDFIESKAISKVLKGGASSGYRSLREKFQLVVTLVPRWFR